MDAKHDTNDAGEDGPSAALSAEEFESWTLVDRSPKAGHLKMVPAAATEPNKKHIDDDEVEDDDEEASDEEDEESGSSDGEVEEDEEAEQEDKSDKPSGVEPVKNKPKQTKDETDGVAARDEDRGDDRAKSNAKLAGSNISLHSHDGSSSDGISVISESDGSDQARLHINKRFNLDQLAQSSVQLTPPLSPERDDDSAVEERSKRNRQLKRKRSHEEDEEDTALVRGDAIVPWRHVNRTSFVILSIVLTGIAAILVGNSRMYENRATINSFDHEKRLSELELENTILKNEMNKLKHLYTRSELDEQVQQAEFEWMQAMQDQERQDQSPTEPEPQPEPEPSTSVPPKPEQPQMRRVPPQDDNIRHRVVWSGDDGQPMLIADKDYVLPEFCYNKNAVQDELFSEYSAKYCDSKQRKIDAKLKKHKHPRDYKQYIHPTAEEVAEHQKQATAPPPKVPSLSPFEFDYRSAFETIKEEGSVILQSLTAILDLDPEPELIVPVPSEGYLADDEASSSSSSSSASSVASTLAQESAPATEAINWTEYPPWVREKYENQPEMHRKLQNKAHLLWEWERKKNQFLDEVGLTTLEEVDRKSEDELRQRRDQYGRERKGGGQSGEKTGAEQESYKKYDKYDERKGKGGKSDERKEYRPRNGDDRSHEHKNFQKQQSKEWKDKERRNGDKSREYQDKQRRDDQRQTDHQEPSTSRQGSHEKQHYKDNNDSDESREVSSGDHDPRYKDKKDYRKSGEHDKYRKDSDEWKDYKKNGDQQHKRRDSDERDDSGEVFNPKKNYQGEYKKQYNSKEEHQHYDKKYDHDRRRNDDDDDHYKRRHHDKHDYRKHEQKEWHDKRHKHKKEGHWNKHEDKKWHDRDREHHHHSKERRR